MESAPVDSKPYDKLDYGLLAFFFIPAALLTWGIHESAHWVTGIALGYEMWISPNQVGLVTGEYRSTLHEILVAGAGPAITCIQGLVAFCIIYRARQLWLYAFLYIACWMRLLAMVISFVSHPNDEAQVGLLLGLPMWVVPSLSVGFLAVLAVLGSRRLNVGWKGNGIAYLMASIVTAAIVVADQVWFPR